MPVDVSTALHRKIKNNDAYIVSEVQEAASGSSVNVHIKNPDGSGKTLWITDMYVTSDGAYIARVHDGFDSTPSGGTPTEIQAMLLDSGGVDNDGVAEANTGVSFTNGSTHAVGVYGGGGRGVSIGGPSNHPSMAIEEGREIVLTVENTGSSANNYGISIVYYEKDGSET